MFLLVPVHPLDVPGGSFGSATLKPFKQVHIYDPTVFLQFELGPQIPVVLWHSSISDKKNNNKPAAKFNSIDI